jgi:hypothetical protein
LHRNGACINGHPILIIWVVVLGTHGYYPDPTFPFTLYVGSICSLLGTTMDATLFGPWTRVVTTFTTFIKFLPRIITSCTALTSALYVSHSTASFQGYVPAKNEKKE